MIETNGMEIVDDEKAIAMLHRAFELGINYVDTAPYYLNKLSEVTVGKALKGYRDKIYLSTKNPIEDDSYDHWMKHLETSLRKLDTDYIDFYHMWGISLEVFKTRIDIKGGPIDAALKAKEMGLIKHLSFSFHDDVKNMKEIIDSGYFESVILQYNLLDRSNEKNIEYAHEKGIGIAVMGPVGGGRLGQPSKVIQSMLKDKVKSTAEMALRFVLANPHVDIALSGMSTMEMVEENVAVASVSGVLTEIEKVRITEMLQEKTRLSELYCTGCNYCMPCPQDINIPYVFSLMNLSKVYGLTDYSKGKYAKLVNKNGNKSKGVDVINCIECGVCEGKCPQKLKIMRQLKETRLALM
jgi:predicted aldo/keto reductase-like oxidoreductase